MTSNIPSFEESRKFSSVFDKPISTEKIAGQGIVEHHQKSKEDAGVFSSLFAKEEVKNEPIRETKYARNTDKFVADFFAKRRAKISESLDVEEDAPPEYEPKTEARSTNSGYTFKNI